MSASICQQVVSSMLAALTNTTACADRVFDSRETAIARGETPCIVIDAPDSEDSHRFGNQMDENTVIVTVDILVRGDPWRSVADPIAVDVHRILMRDPVLQALITSIRRQSRKWQAQEADQTAGSDGLTYQLVYLSASDDMTAQY